MATILELARHAGVPAESVLRVVNGEPVSGDVTDRVNRAIELLGPPPFPARVVEPPDIESVVENARRELLESLTEAAAELETRLPEGVGSLVYEAVRVEVRPVAEHIAEMESLFQHLVLRIHELEARERSERLEDVALLTELITSGWRSVDRRLGRVERMIERLQAQQGGARAWAPRHVEVRPKPKNG